MEQDKKASNSSDAAETTAESAEKSAAVDLPPESEDRPETIEQQLASAQMEAAEHQENLLRALAELENLRRRSEKKLAEAHQFALSSFVPAIGEVRDCLEAALDNAGEKQHSKLSEGVSLTLRKLVSAMDAHSILPIKPDIGVTFDPAIHMAIGRLPASETAAANTVAAVIQAGYMLNGRVIRAANVMVASEDDGASGSTEASKKEETTK